MKSSPTLVVAEFGGEVGEGGERDRDVDGFLGGVDIHNENAAAG